MVIDRNHNSRIIAGDNGEPDRELWEAHPIVEGVIIFPCSEEEHGRVFR
jgi:hypothetical protein